jgi:hypothetical protein
LDTPDSPRLPAQLDGQAVHALSNHLAVILGFIDLVLSSTTPDDPRHADLVEIRDAAVAAARIIGRPMNDTPPRAGG